MAASPATQAKTAPAARIVASFSILADMVREIAPAGFEVVSLVGANADSHVFSPSPADSKHLAQADLVVMNGLGFDAWMPRLIQAARYQGVVVVASDGLTPRRTADQTHAHEAEPERAPQQASSTNAHEAEGGPDPHAWQDLANARLYVRNISQAMQTRWPQQAQEIARRTVDYLARIDQLDRDVRARLAQVPRTARRVVSNHDAFGYLGAAYGIDFLAPQGWSEHSEPSAQAVARLIRQIRTQRIRAVLIENITDPRLIQRIAKESGAQVGGELFSDALSAPGGPADTYLKLFDYNISTILRALGAPVSAPLPAPLPTPLPAPPPAPSLAR